MASSAPRRALVVGATGIVGQSLSAHLVHEGWETFGLSRSGTLAVPGATSIAADLLDRDSLDAALAGIRPDFVAFTAWVRHATEAENIVANSATVRNLLAALEPQGSLKHVALMTGLKHYMGPFEAYGTGVMAETPFHESEERLDTPNFYYAQEDELFASAARNGFGWSVHRSHTVIGFAVGNTMNMVLTLSVYATLCKELGMRFIFPGSETQWNGLTDMTDADLISEQMIWAASHPSGRDQAFNTVNGDIFRWRWMWPQLAAHFGVEWEGFSSAPRTLDSRMEGMAAAWKTIAAKHGLVEDDITRLASWWHTDGDLGRNVEVVTDMTKSRLAGFLNFRSTVDSFTDKIDQYRAARILP
jgi:nucleoside-diphosphate-sugar epimerase